MRQMDLGRIPIINVDSLVSGVGERDTVAAQIREACVESGFFYVVGMAWMSCSSSTGGAQSGVLRAGTVCEAGDRDGEGGGAPGAAIFPSAAN